MVKEKEKPPQDNHKDFQWVDTRQGLQQVVDCFKNQKAIGVDLEMDSMFHFHEKICLIQMATEQDSFIIDPLPISSMSLIKPLFENPRIKKVFHGADYDVRSIFRDYSIEINNLFDTELASRFLGVQHTSLESVLNNRFDVVLDKRFQKKDWSQRPLPEHMVTYAARDACFLVPLARELEKELRGKKRLSWVKEECLWLSKVRPAANSQGPLFLNFKGAGRLKPRDLVVLEALLQYRRGVAMAKDRPLFKTIGNAALLTLANRKPASLKQLKAIRALSSRQSKQYGQELVATIQAALETPENEHPVYPKRRAPSLKPVVSNRIRELKTWRDAKAADLEIDASIVLTKMLICDIAKQRPGSIRQLTAIEGLRNWRVKEFGREIIALLKNLR
ncbi:MAG: HRDC domain-containing protein [Thermodesulfobacteriota bacterium]